MKTIVTIICITLLGVSVATAQKKSLNAGESIQNNGEIESTNGKFVLSGASGGSQGQFCTYIKGAHRSQTAELSATSCMGKNHQPKPPRLTLQQDGNLVISSGVNDVIWASSTTPSGDPKFKDVSKKPVKMLVENDGSIGLYSASGQKVWFHNINPYKK